MKTARIELLIDRPFTEFTDAHKDRVLRGLSIHAGVMPEDMMNVRVEKGCTIFSAEFDIEAVKHLLDVFMNSLGAPAKEDITGFKAFLAENKIKLITGNTPRHGMPKSAAEKARYRPIIIFVHGWNGGDDSFGDFPKFIQEKTGIRTEKYVYPSGVWTHSPDIYLIARNLENWIRNRFSEYQILFIAHSMGGLVVRKLVTTQHWRTEPLDTLVRHLTFVASPHAGTNWAALAKKIPFLQKAQLDSLTPNSPALLELNEQWTAWANRNVPKNCKARCIYGSSDDVVPLNSAIGQDSDGIPMLGKGHIDIVKPTDSGDEIVLTTVRLLKESGYPN